MEIIIFRANLSEKCWDTSFTFACGKDVVFFRPLVN